MDAKAKVVTITLNPALDLTGHVDTLSVGSVTLAHKGSLHAAGKGINVAKVLSDLGAEVTLTGFLGTDNQQPFCQLFSEMGANDQFVRVEGATRINVKLVEESRQVSDINFPGISISEKAIAQFETILFELADSHDFFVLAGSLPKGISPERCANWIMQLRRMGKKVLFDSSRAALSSGLEATPWLIKPNDEELSEWAGTSLTTPEECQKVAERLADKGIENIVISLGEKGVLWLGSELDNSATWLHSQPPKMTIESTVGAGDTLVAGLCWGHLQQDLEQRANPQSHTLRWDREHILSFATALSALAVTQVGVGVSKASDVVTIQQQVILNRLNE